MSDMGMQTRNKEVYTRGGRLPWQSNPPGVIKKIATAKNNELQIDLKCYIIVAKI